MKTSRWLTLAVGAVLLTTCQSSSGPGNGGVPSVVGSYCSSTQVSTAVQEGADWRVTVYWNKSMHLSLTQDRHSCESLTCVLIGGVAQFSQQGAINYCLAQASP